MNTEQRLEVYKHEIKIAKQKLSEDEYIDFLGSEVNYTVGIHKILSNELLAKKMKLSIN